jgi:hypothetical protein
MNAAASNLAEQVSAAQPVAAGLDYLDAALEIILHSESLDELCTRAVTLPQTNGIFAGAHVLLNTDGRLSYDSGHGQLLPINHLEIAKAAIASQKLEFRDETPGTPAMVAIPFMRHGYAEAVGILIMAPGASHCYLQGQLEPILTKLTGFYLESKYGLGH